MTLPLGLLLIAILALSCLAATISNEQQTALAQPYIQTIKHRNLVIDLGISSAYSEFYLSLLF